MAESQTTTEVPSRPVLCSACGQEMYYANDPRHEPEMVVTIDFRNGDYSHRNDGGDVLYVHEHCFEGLQVRFGNSRVSASVAPVVDGISWSALLSVLERLRSKNRNPENEWYHGWNAAIQCLINDVNARAAVPASPADIRDENG